jgi:hypothetical protein
MTYRILFVLIVVLLSSCIKNKEKHAEVIPIQQSETVLDTIIVDSRYTFEEAIEGSKAPKHIIDQLQLIDVQYYSVDGKIHAGQLLINKKLVDDIRYMFDFMLQQKFPIAKVIPIVKYGWNDDLSMEANNTYSFCYRNVAFSKHAQGMAIDINPFFNPLRWKEGFRHRTDKPIGAVYDTIVPGTFYPLHPVIEEFKKKDFIWGRNFKRNHDDHHFEK